MLPRIKICDATKQDTYVYPDLVKVSNFPEDIENNCPFAVVSFSKISSQFIQFYFNF
jgi:hypothetical protein